MKNKDISENHFLIKSAFKGLKERIENLKKFEKSIITAGPLLDKAGTPYGSLLILNFENIAEVNSFLNNDPYAKKKLFQKIIIKEFKKVF